MHSVFGLPGWHLECILRKEGVSHFGLNYCCIFKPCLKQLYINCRMEYVSFCPTTLMYVTSFSSIPYCSNSEYLTQKHTQSESIHSKIRVKFHLSGLECKDIIFISKTLNVKPWTLFIVYNMCYKKAERSILQIPDFLQTK